MHRRLYGDLWTWAGTFRSRELNIGVLPHHITEELQGSPGNVLYRWGEGHWTPQVFGIAAHAEVVRVHPFVDGNGRLTRLLADLVFLAAQGDEALGLYDWHSATFDKFRYVALLRAFDLHRDPTDLAEYIGVRPFGE